MFEKTGFRKRLKTLFKGGKSSSSALPPTSNPQQHPTVSINTRATPSMGVEATSSSLSQKSSTTPGNSGDIPTPAQPSTPNDHPPSVLADHSIATNASSTASREEEVSSSSISPQESQDQNHVNAASNHGTLSAATQPSTSADERPTGIGNPPIATNANSTSSTYAEASSSISPIVSASVPSTSAVLDQAETSMADTEAPSVPTTATDATTAAPAASPMP